MNLKLIALDLDGTLTNDQKEITPRTMEILMKLQKEGVRLALASARPAPGLYAVCDLLQMRAYGGILMSYNGGRIVEASTGKTLYETGMDREETKGILRFLDTLPVNVILDDGVQFYVKDPKAYKIEYECRNNRMTCSEVADLAEFLSFSPVKLLLSVQPEILSNVQKTIAQQLPPSLIVVRTAPFYLEIIPSSINKGKGLLDICQVLGIDRSETAAFGDAENDIPMIRAAGFGVAMGNAEEAVKAAADYVTASNNEDGVALALEKVLADSP
ncbi:MAG: HAD family phosphatase [Lachnospiraceae bacterium]|nr:HAD family phosphatase [Lachnospiraceae bacterium]